MSEENKKNYWILTFLCSAVATILGIGVTFGTTALINSRHERELQRMSAMMLIHNMDESIAKMNEDYHSDENALGQLLHIYNNPGELNRMTAGNDTVQQVAGLLLTGFRPMQFSELTEEKVSGNNDLMTTLDNLQFIDNVNKFISLRKEYLAQYQFYVYENGHQDQIRELVAKYADRQLQAVNFEDGKADFRPMLKSMLDHRFQMLNYISYVATNVQNCKSSVFEMEKLNKQNKKLMGITDKDIFDYLHRNERQASRKNIIGTWTNDFSVSNTDVLTFNPDGTIRHELFYNNLMLFYAGENVCVKATCNGTWKLENGNIIRNYTDTDIETTGKPTAGWTEAHEEALENFIQNLRDGINSEMTDTLSNVIINRVTGEMSVGDGGIELTWTKSE